MANNNPFAWNEAIQKMQEQQTVRADRCISLTEYVEAVYQASKFAPIKHIEQIILSSNCPEDYKKAAITLIENYWHLAEVKVKHTKNSNATKDVEIKISSIERDRWIKVVWSGELAKIQLKLPDIKVTTLAYFGVNP